MFKKISVFFLGALLSAQSFGASSKPIIPIPPGPNSPIIYANGCAYNLLTQACIGSGGGGSGTVTNVTGIDSISGNITTSGSLSLVNDSASPGANMEYATDGSGTRGWFAIPASGTGTVTSVAAGTGMSFSTITTSGNIAIDTTKVPFFTGGISGTASSTTTLNGAGVWTTFLSAVPNLSTVLTAGNNATNQSITHLNTITDNSALLSIDIGNRTLSDTSGSVVLNYQNGHIGQPGSGVKIGDLSTGQLFQLGTGVLVFDWQHQLLISDTGLKFLDWFNSLIYAQDGTTIAESFANTTGQVRMNQYGSGTFTGAAAKWLAVDSSGNIIEEAPPSGGGGITSINGNTTAAQLLVTGTAGTDFNIDSTTTSGTSVFNIPDASGSNRGLVTTGGQTFGGVKNFSANIFAANLSGTNSGDVTLGTPNGLSLSGQILSLALASTSTIGALNSTDWNEFNDKLSSALTDNHIFVGNASNVATDVAMSQDATIVASGAVTVQGLQNTSVNASTPATNAFLFFNGSQWVPQVFTNGVDSTFLSVDASGNVSEQVVSVDNTTITGDGINTPLSVIGAASQNFTLFDNQISNQNIPGMVFDFSITQDVFIKYSLHYISDTGVPLDQNGSIILTFNPINGWRLENGTINFDTLILVDFFVDSSSGQVSYTTGLNDPTGSPFEFFLTWKQEVLP